MRWLADRFVLAGRELYIVLSRIMTRDDLGVTWLRRRLLNPRRMPRRQRPRKKGLRKNSCQRRQLRTSRL